MFEQPSTPDLETEQRKISFLKQFEAVLESLHPLQRAILDKILDDPELLDQVTLFKKEAAENALYERFLKDPNIFRLLTGSESLDQYLMIFGERMRARKSQGVLLNIRSQVRKALFDLKSNIRSKHSAVQMRWILSAPDDDYCNRLGDVIPDI